MNGSAVQFAPAVEGAIEIRGRFGDHRLEPHLTEPTGVGEGRKVELEDAAGTLANVALCRFRRLKRVHDFGAQGQLNLVIGVDHIFDGVTQGQPYLRQPYRVEMSAHQRLVGDVQSRRAHNWRQPCRPVGRAGRQGQLRLVFTYCGSVNSRDQYFFQRRARLSCDSPSRRQAGRLRPTAHVGIVSLLSRIEGVCVMSLSPPTPPRTNLARSKTIWWSGYGSMLFGSGLLRNRSEFRARSKNVSRCNSQMGTKSSLNKPERRQLACAAFNALKNSSRWNGVFRAPFEAGECARTVAPHRIPSTSLQQRFRG